MNQHYFYLQTIREFFSAFFILILWSYLVSKDTFDTVSQFFLTIIMLVPMTKVGILSANLLNSVCIFIFGMIKREFVSLFVVLNGAALGLIFGMYLDNLNQLYALLLPHSLFETLMIILFCVQVKLLNFAQEYHEIALMKRSWMIIIYVCIPLFLLSFWLESFKLS